MQCFDAFTLKTDDKHNETVYKSSRWGEKQGAIFGKIIYLHFFKLMVK